MFPACSKRRRTMYLDLYVHIAEGHQRQHLLPAGNMTVWNIYYLACDFAEVLYLDRVESSLKMQSAFFETTVTGHLRYVVG